MSYVLHILYNNNIYINYVYIAKILDLHEWNFCYISFATLELSHGSASIRAEQVCSSMNISYKVHKTYMYMVSSIFVTSQGRRVTLRSLMEIPVR